MSSTDDGSRPAGRTTFNRIFRQTRAMDDMMRRLGVSAEPVHATGGADSWYVARERCLDCDAGADCARWLASTSGADEAPRFCPNAGYFARCRASGA